jgi:hypothetical protein
MSDFKTAAEIQRYLLISDTKRVSTNIDGIDWVVGYKAGALFNHSHDTPSWQSFEKPKRWKKHLEGWVANIPKIGVLCRVPNIVEDCDELIVDNAIVAITSYEEGSVYPYISEFESYDEAIPLIDREIIEYLSDKELVKYAINYLNMKK